MLILVLNAGSSSQKCALFDLGKVASQGPPDPIWEGQVDLSAQAGTAKLTIKRDGQVVSRAELQTQDRREAFHALMTTLWEGSMAVIAGPDAIDVVGHRVVHGGETYREPTRITPEVVTGITRLAAFAPEHNPAALEGIAAVSAIFGEVPQVAVFDTAFHRDLSPAAATYPVPYAWREGGVRRFGFHGTSYAYCTGRAGSILDRDVASLDLIIAHLGNGASLAAVRGGHSIDTTMGFTPLEGLMMGTRSGSVDPGILLYAERDLGYTPQTLDRTLQKESGLLGVSGVSGDMRTVLAARDAGNERARLAIEVYVHRLRAGIGAMLASLGRLDALVFTGGVGEHSDEIRAAACAPFGFLGLALDATRNAANPVDVDVATDGSAVHVLVIHTREEWMIARACHDIIGASTA